MTAIPAERRPDLDWLRVAAILLLHLYHACRFFNANDPWHLKAPEPIPALNQPMDVLHLLRMPLLMVIAGAVSAYAIQKRGIGGFALDRTKRLLLPLLFGMLVVVPPQIYVEWLDKGRFAGSYWAFWPEVLKGVPYPAGATSWHHLWFVAYLFVYCLLAVPFFGWLEQPSGRAFLRRAEAFFAKGWTLLLPVAPITIIRIALMHRRETNDLLHDPKGVLFYGYLFLVWLFSWATLLATFGFAKRRVTSEGLVLRHLQSLAYPFYILHQTVILVVGYPLMKPAMHPWSRLGWVTLLSFLATWLLCEGIARVAWLCPLFGMGPQPSPRRALPPAEPAEA